VDKNTRCDFQVQRNSSLDKCSNDCEDYPNLAEALAACD